MRSTKIRIIIFLIGSALLLLSGAIMRITESASTGYIYRGIRFQGTGTINGDSAIFLGCLILVGTFFDYLGYKKEVRRVKEWEERIESEGVDFDDWKEAGEEEEEGVD